MRKKKPRRISPYTDRMGRFIGQLRDHEGITLNQLSRGLCDQSMLNKIENGEREAGKLMTDAFFQRLGKPVQLFERILDHEEFVKWTHRQEIRSHLRVGNTDKARECAKSYRIDKTCVLDRQFLSIVAINCHALEGMPARELLPLVEKALLLTQPDFGRVPFDTLLLSQNECHLLLAHLQLREELEGNGAAAEDYRTLARYFHHPRYDSRERVYLFPYVACHVVENDYREGKYASALAVCEEALSELTREKRLFAYDQLLAWKQKLFDVTGKQDQTPGRLLEKLKKLLARAPECVRLLIPCGEQGHVYCLNQVIRSRRALLGFSQEDLSDDACGVRSVSRIENEDRRIRRKNRKLLLQKVNMSGERYDCEIISERYEDHLLRSELDRAIIAENRDIANELLAPLRLRIPNTPTNQQYLLKKTFDLTASQKKPDLTEAASLLENTLHYTLPLDLKEINSWHAGILTVNELRILILYADCCKKHGELKTALTVLYYIDQCLKSTGVDVSYYEDLYTRVGANLSSVLQDMGDCQQATALLNLCWDISLKSQNSQRLARYPYALACNIENQLPYYPEEERQRKRNEALDLLKQAYAAVRISGDLTGQKRIAAYCARVYETELDF